MDEVSSVQPLPVVGDANGGVCAQLHGYPGKCGTSGAIALDTEDVRADVHLQPVTPKDAGVFRRQSPR